MPRVSKERKELTEKKVLRYLLQRPDTEKKLNVVSGLLNSILKTRSTNNQRKQGYIEQLENCFKVLCTHSTDLLETRERLETAQKEIGRQNDLRCQSQDQVLILKRKLKEALRYKVRFHEERKLKYKAEADVGQQLRENNILREKLAEQSK